MKISTKMLTFTVLIMSTMSVISSTNWINIWMAMEMNLMAFIPLMFKSKNSKSSKSIMIYFLIQSMTSIMTISSILTSKILIETTTTNMLIMMIMMIKMGMPPFHQWMPEIMNMMEWDMCLILTTWQKIIPMYILNQLIEPTKFILMIIALASMTGAIGGINQTSTRKLISYSSMNHLGWMILLSSMNKKTWMMYLMLYSIIMLLICLMFKENNIYHMNQTKTFSLSIMDKMSITIMMLSLGGLPPFLGFFPKWIVIQNLISINEMLILFMMVISSLITLSYYLRMVNLNNLMYSNSQKWILMKKKQISTKILIINTSLPLIMIMFNI